MSAQKQLAKIAAYRGGMVLMGLRRDDKKWCFPGGHLDKGEKPLDGARRELLEETGLRASEMEPLGVREVKDGEIKVHAFRAEVDESPDSSSDPDAEFKEFKWVNPARVPKEITDNLHSKHDVVLEMIMPARAWAGLVEE